MRDFHVLINLMLHPAEYAGRRYSESGIVVVMALGLCGPLGPTDLASEVAMQKGSLTTVFLQLTKLGLIRLSDEPGTDRSHLLELTGMGRAFLGYLDA